MNKEGTNIGPQISRILEVAVAYQRRSGTVLVVAPGRNPNFPNQPQSYAAMMADNLVSIGADKVVVLDSDHFSTYGELSAFYRYCEQQDIKEFKVLGQRWHLWRAICEARGVNLKWAARLKVVPVAGSMSAFDLMIEPLKWLKLILPRQWQIKAISFWRRFISHRTSY